VIQACRARCTSSESDRSPRRPAPGLPARRSPSYARQATRRSCRHQGAGLPAKRSVGRRRRHDMARARRVVVIVVRLAANLPGCPRMAGNPSAGSLEHSAGWLRAMWLGLRNRKWPRHRSGEAVTSAPVAFYRTAVRVGRRIRFVRRPLPRSQSVSPISSVQAVVSASATGHLATIESICTRIDVERHVGVRRRTWRSTSVEQRRENSVGQPFVSSPPRVPYPTRSPCAGTVSRVHLGADRDRRS